MNSIVVKSFEINQIKQLRLPIITVYYNTTDFPEKYVARLFNSDRPTPLCVVKDSLEEIRSVIPPMMIRLDRQPGDDPVILEVWV